MSLILNILPFKIKLWIRGKDSSFAHQFIKSNYDV